MNTSDVEPTAIADAVTDLIHDFNRTLQTTAHYRPKARRFLPPDDPTPEPKFHRLLDLPLELRCEIYEHYFCDDLRSLACKDWRIAGRTYIYSWKPSYPYFGKNQPFLPALCFVSRAMLTEVMKRLLRNAHIRIDGHLRRMLIQIMINCCMLPIPEHICTLELGAVTFAGPERFYDEFEYIRQPPQLCAARTVRLHNELLSRCSNVRTLHLTFWTPHRRYSSRSYRPHIATPIDSFIEDFDPQPILDMENLQKLEIVGRCKHTVTEEEETEDRPLQGVMDLGCRIQNGCRSLGRTVAITVWLYHSEHEVKGLMSLC
jgi:hypothetical protein